MLEDEDTNSNILRTWPTYIQETQWAFQETGRGCIQDWAKRKKAGHEMKCFLPSFTCSFNLKQRSVRHSVSLLPLIHSVPATGLQNVQTSDLQHGGAWSVSYLK